MNRTCPYTGRTWYEFQSLLHQGISLLVAVMAGVGMFCEKFVSIPSSSGHQFTASRPRIGTAPGRGRFNPFFIRASVYWKNITDPTMSISSFPFQSLLHQGISLLDFSATLVGSNASVSIPSSSGHQFTAARPRRRRRPLPGVSIPSSSGHQFTDIALFKACCAAHDYGFNPFFIRASVYCIGGARRAADDQKAFQSLLHQGISLLVSEWRVWIDQPYAVSIPSSSGHQFTARGHVLQTGPQPGFQSLLHQGISLLARSSGWPGRGQLLQSFNPFFIRASVYWRPYAPRVVPSVHRFQSLLHQGISLLYVLCWSMNCGLANSVSIPSSSGHQFTVRRRR